jgi:cystathionine beta-lyase
VQDVPAITAAARAAGVRTVMDNTWATPLYFKPLAQGVDVAVQSATKYLVGHSDAMLGIVTSNKEAEADVQAARRNLGQCASPDDIYLAMRGLRTLEVRLARHQESALEVARWLAARPEVERVLYPALPEDPGHAIWRRDFTGASGLFGFVLARPTPKAAVNAMVDGLDLFGIGSSWGGFESLMTRTDPARGRTATSWTAPGPSLRLHIGLEDPADLIADLDAGFTRLAEVSAAEGETI